MVKTLRTILLLLLLGFYSELGKAICLTDPSKCISTTKKNMRVQSIDIDVQTLLENKQTVVADPITLSCSTDQQLNLLVHSSVYTDYASNDNQFRVTNDLDSCDAPSFCLGYTPPPTTDGNERKIKIWTPKLPGTVVLEFEGDLPLRKPKSRLDDDLLVPKNHVFIQVPVTVVE